MEETEKRKSRKRWLIPLAALVILAAFFFAYAADYYPADPAAIATLASDETVAVTETSFGWFFDGPSEDTALIFYPGAKVEEAAYAPFLHKLAASGADAFLVRMPLRLSLFGIGKAGAIQSMYSYDHWYIGGHSLGGASAAYYARQHADRLDGVVFCAAYPTSAMDDALTVVTIYGTNDRVLNRFRYEWSERYLPPDTTECVIEGGNHAQFGNYGPQDGDGEAAISTDEQQQEAVEAIAAGLLS